MSSLSSAEHFGIAIAEATTVGLVSVVYRDGEGWTDIASRIGRAEWMALEGIANKG